MFLNYVLLYSSSSISLICFIKAFALAAAARLGRNSVASGFRFFSLTSGLTSQDNSRGYNS